jgi:hypothetical protein
MEPFVYNALPARVIFGWGTIKSVANEVKRLDCVSSIQCTFHSTITDLHVYAQSRALVLTTPQQSEAGKIVMEYLVSKSKTDISAMK